MTEIIPVEQTKGIAALVTGCSGPTDTRSSPATSWQRLTLEKRYHPTSVARTVGARDSEWICSDSFRGCNRIAVANPGGI